MTLIFTGTPHDDSYILNLIRNKKNFFFFFDLANLNLNLVKAVVFTILLLSIPAVSARQCPSSALRNASISAIS